ncbi:glycosyltransferase family 2 protein [Deinococcus sp. 6YEL10]|uniref:glycosyltransferase n=1 Tax=Deinococcus sp. 6YEL10 TaxID=2745870 RepID=UPI001E46DAE3|nr:glycosyltransferase family 2 protein [Deinococcus sp. 6YEL10]MCD0160820.1 glycosyltransferase family 2 protein [Deinococcus sp. 6YEL10]
MNRTAILIINYNSFFHTHNIINQLLLQTWQKFDIYVLDNSPTDCDYKKLLSLNSGNLKIIKSGENLGFARGNNLLHRTAIDSEYYDYFWILNNDIVINNINYMHDMISFAENYSKDYIFGSVLYNSDGTLQAVGGGKYNKSLGKADNNLDYSKDPDYITGASMLIPNKIIEENGLFDSDFFMYWEDTEISFRYRARGIKFAIFKGDILVHLESGSAVSKDSALGQYLSSYKQFCKKVGVSQGLFLFHMALKAAKYACQLKFNRVIMVLRSI